MSDLEPKRNPAYAGKPQRSKIKDQKLNQNSKIDVKYRAFETKYWLAMLRELLPTKKEEINMFLKEVEEISKILGTSILTMKGKTKL